MSDTLLGKVIRLASANADLRPHLLPLIRKASAEKQARGFNWNEKIEAKGCRIMWAGHPAHYAVVQELPGKPLKRKLRKAVFSLRGGAGIHNTIPSSLLFDNVVRDAKFSKSMTFEKAVDAFKKALDKAAKDEDPNLHDFQREGLKRLPSMEEVFWLEVEPADYSPIEAKAKDFVVRSEWKEWRAYSPDSDLQNHDPSYTLKKSKSAAAARKMFKLLKADPTTLKNVSWYEFSDWLKARKIHYEIQFSVWR